MSKQLDYQPATRRTAFLSPAADRWIGVGLVIVLLIAAALYATGVIAGGL